MTSFLHPLGFAAIEGYLKNFNSKKCWRYPAVIIKISKKILLL